MPAVTSEIMSDFESNPEIRRGLVDLFKFNYSRG
jgi:hypothetical protein